MKKIIPIYKNMSDDLRGRNFLIMDLNPESQIKQVVPTSSGRKKGDIQLKRAKSRAI
jgi:hypothetical protein